MKPFGLLRFAVTLTAAMLVQNAARAIDLPNGSKVEKVDFERHIMGLFSKTGCNNGSCHGSFQGKNGFRLSLFGLEPERDFSAITREIQGRRLNVVDPESSLLLQKAAGLVKHDGGARFSKDSWQYAIFRQWIQQGAPRGKGTGEVVDIAIQSGEYLLVKPGATAKIKVTAKFTDGTTEDVTAFCDFKIQDDAVARATLVGEISGVRPGDSGFTALYRGKVAAARILVPSAAVASAKYPEPVNYIDREVFEKLKMLQVLPSERSSDEEFLRRVTIDVTGTLPTPEEIRAFLADKSPNKREAKIDALLKHPLHAAVWATKLSDVTGNNTLALEQPADMQNKRSQMWHDWLRHRIATNMPYDQIVKGILTATTLEGQKPESWIEALRKIDEDAKKYETTEYAKRETLDLFWRRQQQVPIIEWGEKVAAAFMGVRLECAQCHKHPTDRWTQADYRAFANLFAGVNFTNNQFSTPEVKKVADAETAERNKNVAKNNQRYTVRELFVSSEPRRQVMLNHPDTNVPLNPKAPLGPEFKYERGKDIRAELFEWLRTPDNPFFARSFVNRMWAHYFGIGLVDPVDDFSQANPPSNARLLNALAKDFVESKFDIRRLEKAILMSRTYQNSSSPNETNKFDRNNFARSYVRPLMAEMVVDVVNDAIGVSENFGTDVPTGKKMVEIGASRLNNVNLAYLLRIFGRPPRTTACDCERSTEPALPQTLFRMTDPGILAKLRAGNNRVAGLVKEKNKTDDQIFEELFLATLSRMPKEHELTVFKEHRAKSSDRLAAFTDVMWALINTREFILNH